MIVVHALFHEKIAESLHLFIFLDNLDKNDTEKRVKKIIKNIEKNKNHLDKTPADKKTLQNFFGEGYLNTIGLLHTHVRIHYVFQPFHATDAVLQDIHALLYKYAIPELYGPRHQKVPLYIWHRMNIINAHDVNHKDQSTASKKRVTETEIPTLFHYKSDKKDSFYLSLYNQNAFFPVNPSNFVQLPHKERQIIHDHIIHEMSFENHIYIKRMQDIVDNTLVLEYISEERREQRKNPQTFIFQIQALPQLALTQSNIIQKIKNVDKNDKIIEQLTNIYYPSEIFRKGIIPLYDSYVNTVMDKQWISKSMMELSKKQDQKAKESFQIQQSDFKLDYVMTPGFQYSDFSFSKDSHSSNLTALLPDKITIPLDVLFQRQKIDKNIPFVRYQSRQGVFYKLHKESLSPQGPISFEKHIKTWIKYDLSPSLGGLATAGESAHFKRFRKEEGEEDENSTQESKHNQQDDGRLTYQLYLNLSHVQGTIYQGLTSPKFVTLHINADGKIKIMIKFSVYDMNISINFVQEYVIPQLNTAIQSLYRTIKNEVEVFHNNLPRFLGFLPIIQPVFWSPQTHIFQYTHDINYRLQSRFRFEKKSGARNHTFQDIKHAIEVLEHFFFIIQEDSTVNEIKCVYKGNPNFIDPHNIQVFIQQFLQDDSKQLTSLALKKKVEDTAFFFGLDKDTAKNIIDLFVVNQQNTKSFQNQYMRYTLKEWPRFDIKMFRNYFDVELHKIQDVTDKYFIIDKLRIIFTDPQSVMNLQKLKKTNDNIRPFSPSTPLLHSAEGSTKQYERIKKAFKKSQKRTRSSPFSPSSLSPSKLSQMSPGNDMDGFDDMDDDLFEIMQQELKDASNASHNDMPNSKLNAPSLSSPSKTSSSESSPNIPSTSSSSPTKNTQNLPTKTLVQEKVHDMPFTKISVAEQEKQRKAGKAEIRKTDKEEKFTRERLDHLKEADDVLFGSASSDPRAKSDTRYSRKCQVENQPIVISPEELLNIRKKYPGSVPNWVLYGSTHEKAKKNVYFCPDVWCPQSRVALTRLQYEQKGKTCPSGEKGLVTYHENKYDILDPTRKFVIGKKRAFVNLKIPHPNKRDYGGLCLPCCYIKPPKNKTECGNHKVVEGFEKAMEYGDEKEKKRIKAKEEGKETNTSSDSSDSRRSKHAHIDAEKYIMKEDTIPLPPNRLGLLPEIVTFILMGDNAYAFHNKGVDIHKERVADKKSRFAASHLVGTEKGPHFNKNTRGFVRQGISMDTRNSKQNFLQCMVHMLQHPLLKTVDDLIQHIVHHFKMHDFLFLQNGLLCQKFMPTTLSIQQKNEKQIHQDPEFLNEFRAFLTHPDNKMFVSKFALDKYVKQIQNYKDNQLNKMDLFDKDAMSIIHLMRLFQSFQAFHEYLQDDRIIKTHDVMLPLFMQKSSWLVQLNLQNQNIIVFEMQNGKPVFTCPNFGKPFAHLFNKKLPFMFLFKQDHIYEPIIFVNYVGVKLEKRTRVDFNSFISRLLFTLERTCHTAKQTPLSQFQEEEENKIKTILTALQLLDKDIKYQVIDYNFNLIGFVLEGHIYIPLRTPSYMRENLWRDRKILFIREVYSTINPHTTRKEVMHILNEINKNLGEKYYNVSPRSTDTFLFIVFGEKEHNMPHNFLKQAIPLAKITNIEDFFIKTYPKYGFFDDLQIFLRLNFSDSRFNLVETTAISDYYNTILYNEIVHAILHEHIPNISDTLIFLRNSNNPLPNDIKRKLLFDLFDPYLRKNVIFFVSPETPLSEMFSTSTVTSTCSDITRDSECKLQCRWKNGKCKVLMREEWYKTFMAQILDNLLNPAFKLKKKFPHKPFFNDKVQTFTPEDIEKGELDSLFYQHNEPFKANGVKQKDIPFDVDAFYSAPFSDGRTESFRKVITSGDIEIDASQQSIKFSDFTNSELSHASSADLSNTKKELREKKLAKRKEKKKMRKEQKQSEKRTIKLTRIPNLPMDLLPDYKRVPNFNYNKMSIFEIFSVVLNHVHDADPNSSNARFNFEKNEEQVNTAERIRPLAKHIHAQRRMTPNILREILLKQVERRFKRNSKALIEEMQYYDSLFLESGHEITIQGYRTWLEDDPDGYPGDFEIRSIGKFININTVVIQRVTDNHPFNINPLYSTNNSFIVLLAKIKAKDTTLNFFTYEVIQREKNFIFFMENLPLRFNKKLREVILFVEGKQEKQNQLK